MSAPNAPEVGLEMLRKADGVIQALQRSGSLTVAEIADELDEPTSSVYRLLSSLTAIGLVDAGLVRGRYRLGLEMMTIGEALEQRIDIRPLARSALRTLRDDSGLTSFLCVRRGSRAACIERIEGRGVRSLMMLIGASLPLYAGAAPKALLAFLPRSERERFAASAVPLEPTDPEKPEVAEILAETALIRSQGYALSDQDVTTGVAAVGAPVFNHRGEVAASVSVSGLRDTVLDDLDAHVAGVRDCAREVSARLGFDGSDGRRQHG